MRLGDILINTGLGALVTAFVASVSVLVPLRLDRLPSPPFNATAASSDTAPSKVALDEPRGVAEAV
jgi:hypothetical protein